MKLNHSLEMEKASQWRPVLHLRRKRVAVTLCQAALATGVVVLETGPGLFKGLGLGLGGIFNGSCLSL